MKIDINQLKEHPLNKEIYGEDEEQLNKLVDRIKVSGWIEPIIINKDYTILSGHQRYRAAKKLNYTSIDYQLVSVPPEQELEILLNANQYREKTTIQKLKEAEYYHEVESRKALLRQISGTTLEFSRTRGRTNEIVAKKIDMSPSSYKRARKALKNSEKITEEGLQHLLEETLNTDITTAQKLSEQPLEVIQQVQDLIDGDATQVGKVLRNLENLEIRKAIPLPPGRYTVIYTEHNKSEDFEKFSKISIGDLAQSDSILLLWTLPLLLDQAIKLLHLWGFHYKTAFLWNKDVMNDCSDLGEVMLIGTRGNPPMISLSKENRPETIKPAIITNMIEQGFPQVDKVKIRLGEGWELF